MNKYQKGAYELNSFKFDYDEVRDVFHIQFSDDKLSEVLEVYKNIFIKKDIKTKKLTSITIVDFKKMSIGEEKDKSFDIVKFILDSPKKTNHESEKTNADKDCDFFLDFLDKKDKNRIKKDIDEIWGD